TEGAAEQRTGRTRLGGLGEYGKQRGGRQDRSEQGGGGTMLARNHGSYLVVISQPDADAPRWQCGAGCPAGAQATSGPRHQQFRFQRYECLRIENNRACPELERLVGGWGTAEWAVIG